MLKMRSPAATGVSVVALILGVLIARDCDAADWQQFVMLFVLPVVAGGGIGVKVSASSTDRVSLDVGLALAVAIVAALAFIALWGGECSR